MIPYAEVVPTRWGNMIALRCDPYQYRSLACYGEWARDEMSVCLDLIKPGDVVLDVGAHIGTTTVPFALRVGPNGRVFAFEPQLLPFRALEGNLVITGVSQWVVTNRVAIGEKCGTITVPIIDPRQPNNAGGVRLDDTNWDHFLKTAGEREEVRMVTIDSLNLPRCDFIKADVEAMEAKVLAGAADTIDNYKPIIWAEALTIEPSNREAMWAFFQLHHYRCWEFVTRIYSDDNLRFSRYNPYSEQADVNVLAIHESVKPPGVTKKVCEFKP